MSVSEYGAQQWAGVLVGLGSVPANFWIALCTDEPGEGWDGTVVPTIEPQGSASYSRVSIPTGSTGWALSDAGYTINVVALAFPVPDVDWGVITNFAILDDQTAGNLWAYGAFTDAIAVLAGSDVSLAPGVLQLGVANLLSSIAE